MKTAIILSGVSLGVLLSAFSCANSVTAEICSDAAALQASPVKLNANATTAMTGLMAACASTAGGTVVNDLTVANAMIQDAVILQNSGLLNSLSIRAQAPATQRVLERIKLHLELLR